MSRAFVKEDDPTGGAVVLPDRMISPHPNLVTPRGLRQIEAQVAACEQALAEAGDEAAQARAERELRYWAARLGAARLTEPEADVTTVRCGTTVTAQQADGTELRLAIVGEDEADPASGTLSYVSPLARALIGKSPGDTVKMGPGEIEIIAIS